MTGLWTALAAACGPEARLHLPRGAREPATIPFEQVMATAEGTAAQLTAACRPAGDRLRIGLLMANGEPWVRGLLAAFRSGAVAVPLATPASASGLDGHLRQTERVATAARLDAILVDSGVARLAARLREHVPAVPLIDITDVPTGRPVSGLTEGAGADLAVVQFTSGSTSAPKGVTLTHDNVLAGLRTIMTAIRYTDRDRLGLWLPLYHDMGLFSLLTAFLTGGPVWLWRPSDFIRDPVAWLNLVSRAGITTVPAPNFAYDYLISTAHEGGLPGDLDLSAWRLALNGAEPVRRHTVEEFHRVFARYGLPHDTMRSCYGLAEATLMATFADGPDVPGPVHVDRFSVREGNPVRHVAEHDPASRAVMSTGRPAPGISVRIGQHEPDGVVGEIQLRGPAVTRGYLDLPAAAQPFTADGWLRTGDLGFLTGGELYVTGRSKDMIVVRGQNYYAEDIEELVRETAGPAGLRCAAYQAGDLDETMHIVLETPLTGDAATELARRIEQDVAVRLSGQAVTVSPVAPRTIPVTTSGKVKRHALRPVQAA